MRGDVYNILAAAALILAISFGDEGCGRAAAFFASFVPILTVAAAKSSVKDDAGDAEGDEGASHPEWGEPAAPHFVIRLGGRVELEAK